MNIAIKVEHLSKSYMIRHQGQTSYVALRDVIAEKVGRTFNKTKGLAINHHPNIIKNKEEFWALNDVNFEVQKGERVGIIGRNGAGKSTLLKILSRITEPTLGRFSIQGRIASLLEVGTGFHPELTGRENIYLNGAILGMHRAEIKRKFEEIVAFSGVEKFLDTPVKRYSSGMYVRLAFAVAAHLESEILVVDEVLAVGDAEFQKKCFGKMQDISQKEGKTILLVSHNMQAIRNICTSSVLLNEGRVEAIGSANDIINRYLSRFSPSDVEGISETIRKLPKDESFEIISIKIKQNDIETLNLGSHLPTEIIIDYKVQKEESGLRILFDLVDDEDNLIFRSFHDELSEEIENIKPGRYISKAIVPSNLLGPLSYKIIIRAGIHKIRWCTPDEGIIIPVNVSLSGTYNKAYPTSTFVGKLGLSINWETIPGNEFF